MSKRKNRTANIPQETLDQVQGQAAKTAPPPANVESVEAAAPKPVRVQTPPRPRTRTSERRASGGNTRTEMPSGLKTRAERERERMLDINYVRNRLANPTVAVTEDQLHQEYSHVLKDLRATFVLAGILVVAIIVIGQFI
jgi:hypothetical protein